MSTTTRWWWVRHATVTGNGGRIYGASDVDADCTDPAPFAALSRLLPARAAWVVTPLRRTRQTFAAVMANRTGAGAVPEPIVEAGFAEQNFGDWQGLTHAEIDATRPGVAHRFWLAPATERAPGGESFADVAARVAGAVAVLNRQLAGRDIVSFAHGGSIRAAIGHALALDLDSALRFRIDNLSVTRLDHILLATGTEAWRIVTVNLPPLASAERLR